MTVAFHDLRLEGGNLLLSLDLGHVGGRSHTAADIDLCHLLFLLTQIIVHLILKNHLLKYMSLIALFFVVAKDLGYLVGVCSHDLPYHTILLLYHELLDAVGVDLKLFVAELVLSKVLIARY